jgi:hypothetical protein
MNWFYLSFASKTEFLGACVVEAADARDAVRVARERGINPGGEIFILPTPGNVQGPLPAYKLLTRAELGDAASLGELVDAGRLPPEDAAMVAEADHATIISEITIEAARRRWPGVLQ